MGSPISSVNDQCLTIDWVTEVLLLVSNTPIMECCGGTVTIGHHLEQEIYPLLICQQEPPAQLFRLTPTICISFYTLWSVDKISFPNFIRMKHYKAWMSVPQRKSPFHHDNNPIKLVFDTKVVQFSPLPPVSCVAPCPPDHHTPRQLLPCYMGTGNWKFSRILSQYHLTIEQLVSWQ